MKVIQNLGKIIFLSFILEFKKSTSARKANRI